VPLVTLEHVKVLAPPWTVNPAGSDDRFVTERFVTGLESLDVKVTVTGTAAAPVVVVIVLGEITAFAVLLLPVTGGGGVVELPPPPPPPPLKLARPMTAPATQDVLMRLKDWRIEAPSEDRCGTVLKRGPKKWAPVLTFYADWKELSVGKLYSSAAAFALIPKLLITADPAFLCGRP